MKPRLGQIVLYRGKHGLQTMRAAIVTATAASLDQRGVDAGHVPPLTDDWHVHLWVWTPAASGPNEATGGFAEFDVAPGEPGADGLIPPGTWCWQPTV